MSTITSTAKKTAIITFAGGTFLMFCFYLTNSWSILMICLVYAAIMAIVNFAILFTTLLRSYRQHIQWQNSFKAVAILFINLPVFILYCWLGFILSNIVRIKFVNPGNTYIKSLKVSGCEEHLIPQLEPGESKTVWIHIPHDCSVYINYKIGSQTKREDVTGYVTNEGGYRMTFKIGTNQKPYDQDL